MENNYFVETLREDVPLRPWSAHPYGCSLSDVRDADGRLVLDEINIAVAEFIVAAVNKESNG